VGKERSSRNPNRGPPRRFSSLLPGGSVDQEKPKNRKSPTKHNIPPLHEKKTKKGESVSRKREMLALPLGRHYCRKEGDLLKKSNRRVAKVTQSQTAPRVKELDGEGKKIYRNVPTRNISRIKRR